MSRSAGSSQWELENKLACQLAASDWSTGNNAVLSLATPAHTHGRVFFTEMWSSQDPRHPSNQLLANLQLNFRDIPQTPWDKMIPNVKTLTCHAVPLVLSCESWKF